MTGLVEQEILRLHAAIESALQALGATTHGPSESHAGYNLMGALIDSREGRFDDVCINTMDRVTKQIFDATAILTSASAVPSGLCPVETAVGPTVHQGGKE